MDYLISDNLACLEQSLELLSRLDSEQYNAPCPSCFNSTVGGHIRHNVDHYLSFAQGLSSGRIDYDARLRNSRIEQDADYAASVLREIQGDLKALESMDLRRTVEIKMDCGSVVEDADAWSPSSLRRELQFLLSHTVHHFALIAVICQHHGVVLAKHFGVAPSTLKHKQTASA